MRFKNRYKIGVLTVFFIFSTVICIDYWVANDVKNQMYHQISKTPYNRVGLLLGTSKYAKGGKQNLFLNTVLMLLLLCSNREKLILY